jgi:hypothetical protein
MPTFLSPPKPTARLPLAAQAYRASSPSLRGGHACAVVLACAPETRLAPGWRVRR